MATRPATVNINSGDQGWDGRMDDNFDIITEAPFPIYESAAITSLAALETAFPAAAHDRCFAWINLTTYGYTLCASNGTAWITYGTDRRPVRTTAATITQLVTDKFVRFTTSGTTYNFLAVASWPGRSIEIRNDGVGTVTLDPNASETINGAATITIAAGGTARVYNDGAALYAAIST